MVCAMSALLDGSSTLMEFASPLMIYVQPMMKLELAHNAIKDITSKEPPALETKSLVLLTLVARPGTGTTKCV